MNLIRLYLAFILGLASPGHPLRAAITDPIEVKSPYQRDFDNTFSGLFRDLDRDSIQKKLKDLIAQPNRSPYEKYLLQRALVNEYRFNGDPVASDALCRSLAIHEDDYENASACVIINQGPLSEKRKQLESILNTAIRDKPNTNVPAQVARKIARCPLEAK